MVLLHIVITFKYAFRRILQFLHHRTHLFNESTIWLHALRRLSLCNKKLFEVAQPFSFESIYTILNIFTFVHIFIKSIWQLEWTCFIETFILQTRDSEVQNPLLVEHKLKALNNNNLSTIISMELLVALSVCGTLVRSSPNAKKSPISLHQKVYYRKCSVARAAGW